MNGPVILHSIREQLADCVRTYSAPAPDPLRISPWVAMSLLQKSIRRGEFEHAQRAAATLLLIAPDRLWRRIGAAAFEEIGTADLRAVALATACLSGKRYRAALGGEWKVASFVVEQMVRADKCRASDDLLLTADLHPRYARARTALATKETSELIRIAAGSAALPVRALAVWYAVGTRTGQSKHLSARRGEPAALFDGLCEAGLPHSAVEIAREGFRRVSEPLCPFVALLCGSTTEASVMSDDELPEEAMVGEVPTWALDVYSREGRLALDAFLQTECKTAQWVRDRIRPGQRVNFIGTVLFRVEGGLVRRRTLRPTANELRRLVDMECHGVNSRDATEVLALMRSDLGALNEERANIG